MSILINKLLWFFDQLGRAISTVLSIECTKAKEQLRSYCPDRGLYCVKFKGRSEVKLVFHLETLGQTSPENLNKIKNEGVFAIGLDKELIVPRDNKG